VSKPLRILATPITDRIFFQQNSNNNDDDAIELKQSFKEIFKEKKGSKFARKKLRKKFFERKKNGFAQVQPTIRNSNSQ
jgi:hypothetical protein